MLGRINPKWLVWFVIIAIGLTVGIAVWLSSYVVLHNETTEGDDFDQLAKIIDPLQSIATLMIGTIFGFTVQSGATALNKEKADKNKEEADKQHEQATENAKRAQTNAETAAVQARAARGLRDTVNQMRPHVRADAMMGPRAEAATAPAQLNDFVEDALAKADADLLRPEDYQRYLRKK